MSYGGLFKVEQEAVDYAEKEGKARNAKEIICIKLENVKLTYLRVKIARCRNFSVKSFGLGTFLLLPNSSHGFCLLNCPPISQSNEFLPLQDGGIIFGSRSKYSEKGPL